MLKLITYVRGAAISRLPCSTYKRNFSAETNAAPKYDWIMRA